MWETAGNRKAASLDSRDPVEADEDHHGAVALRLILRVDKALPAIGNWYNARGSKGNAPAYRTAEKVMKADMKASEQQQKASLQTADRHGRAKEKKL